MNFIKFKSFYSENLDFNKVVEPLLEDFFSPASIGEEGYIPVGEYRTNLADKYSKKSKLQEEVLYSDDPLDRNSIIDENYLKGYEKSLALRLLYGKMLNYVVSGPMGSGKSTTINYILKFIQKSKIGENSIIIQLDFNENYDIREIDELMNYFLEDLYTKLKFNIIESVHRHKIADKFLSQVQSDEKFAKFYNLYFEKKYKKNDEWEEYDEREKIYTIFKFIETSVERYERRVDLTMRLLNFVGQFIKTQNGIVFIHFDNIDKLPPVAQVNILNKIFAFNKIAEIKKIIAVRRSTKAKLNNSLRRRTNYFINNRSQTIYGHIYHHGPSPRAVYLIKLNYLISNIDQLNIFAKIQPKFKDALINRAKELVIELERKRSNFSEAIYCTAGESKRLGLTLVQRNFCNHIYKFNHNAPNSNAICRSLYTGNNDKNIIKYNDYYIANVLANNNMQFDIIHFLFFQLIRKNNETQTASYYYDFLYDIFEYEDEEIIESINYLMSDKRALIGGEYFPNYKTSNDLFMINDKLRITELGDRYFDKLLMHGAIYTQTCLFSLKWNFASNNPFRDSLISRIELMRNIISEIKEVEEHKMELYDYNIKSYEMKTIDFVSLTEKITLLHFDRFLRIISGFDKKSNDANSEIEMWLDMVNYWAYNNPKYRSLNQKINILYNKVYK